jgi:hypothetical protein
MIGLSVRPAVTKCPGTPEQQRPLTLVLRECSGPLELAARLPMTAELGQEVAARSRQQVVLAEGGFTVEGVE